MTRIKRTKTEQQELAWQIKDMRNEGFNQVQIARVFNMSQTGISKIARAFDVIDWPTGAAARDQTGSNNPNYINGESRSTINRLTKSILLKAGRDLFQCERCRRNKNIELPRHHKDRDRSNNDPNNLEVLCVICHNKEHDAELLRDTDGTFMKKIR